MNIERASAAESALLAVIPASWSVEARNTEIRPGHDARYKVVAEAAGIAIVAAVETGLFHVTINNGPGQVESVRANAFGEAGFETAAEAFDKITQIITRRHKRVVAQFASLN